MPSGGGVDPKVFREWVKAYVAEAISVGGVLVLTL